MRGRRRRRRMGDETQASDLARKFLRRCSIGSEKEKEALAAGGAVEYSRAIDYFSPGNDISVIMFCDEDCIRGCKPLFEVEQWEKDGLLFYMSHLEREEKRQAGFIKRCMRAAGAYARTSAKELIIASEEETVAELMQGLAADHDDGRDCTLECLQIIIRHEYDDLQVAGPRCSLSNALARLPPSLRFLSISCGRTSGHEDYLALANDPRSNMPRNVEFAHGLAALLSHPRGQLEGLELLIDCPSEITYADVGLACIVSFPSLKALSLTGSTKPGGITITGQFIKMLSTNTTLTTLHLKYFTMPGPLGFDYFFQCLASNKSLKQLTLWGCHGKWTLESILDSLQANELLHDINVRDTPLEGNPAIQAQLERNRQNARLLQLLAEARRPADEVRQEMGTTAEPLEMGPLTHFRPASVPLTRVKLDCVDEHQMLFSCDAALPASSGETFSAGIINEVGRLLAEIVATLFGLPRRSLQASTISSASSYAETDSVLDLKVQPNSARLFLCGRPFSGKTTLAKSMAKLSSHSQEEELCNACIPCSSLWQNPPRTRGIEVTTLTKNEVKIAVWDMAGDEEYFAFHDYMFPDLSNQSTQAFFLILYNPIQLGDDGHDKRDECGKIVTKKREQLQEELGYWFKFITSKTRKSKSFKPKVLVALTRKDHHGSKLLLKNDIDVLRERFNEVIQFNFQDDVFEVDARSHHSVSPVLDHIFEVVKKTLPSARKVFHVCERLLLVLTQEISTGSISPLITKKDFEALCEKHIGIGSGDLLETIALSLNDSGDLIYLKPIDFVVVDTRWFCQRIMGNLIYYSAVKKGTPNSYSDGFFPLEFLEKCLEEEEASILTDRKFKRRKGDAATKLKGEDLAKLLVGLKVACPIHLADDGSYKEVFIPAALAPPESTEMFKWKDQSCERTEFLGRRLKCHDSQLTFITPGVFGLLQVTFHQDSFARSNMEVLLEPEMIYFRREGVEVRIELCKDGGGNLFIDVLVKSLKDLDSTVEWVNEHVLNVIIKVCASSRGIQGVGIEQEVIRPLCVVGPSNKQDRRKQAVPVVTLREQLEKAVRRNRVTDMQFKNELYSWPVDDEGTTLPVESSSIKDLLGGAVLLEACEQYHQDLIALKEAMGSQKLVSNMVKESDGTTQEKDGRAIQQDSNEASGSDASLKAFILRESEKIQDKLSAIQRGLEMMEGKIDELRRQLMAGVAEVLTFLEETESGMLPCMFVVEKDKALVKNLMTRIVPGLHNARLELLCEYPDRPHRVDGQQGLSFTTLDDGVLKKALPYLNTFLAFANAAVKAGVHIAAGVSILVPNFTDLLSSIEDLPDVLDDFSAIAQPEDAPPQNSLHSYHSRVDFVRGREWLWGILRKQNCDEPDQIYKTFKLRFFRYEGTHRVAWLCDEHNHLSITRRSKTASHQ